MPTLSFFYGIKITMYWNDHPPPHFHATAEGQVVVIDIGTPTVLWGEISVRHLRLVLERAKLHQAELMEAWELFEPTSTASDHSAALSEDSVMSPSIPWYVVEVEPLEGYRLRVKFEDGLEGEIHLAWRIFAEPAGIFGSLRDEQVFRDVFIDHGAVTWRNGMDIAPDASYDDIKRDDIQDEASWNRGEALAKAQMKAGKKIA